MQNRAAQIFIAIILLFSAGCSKPQIDLHLKLDAPTSDAFSHYKLVVDGVAGNPIPSAQPFDSTIHAHKSDNPQDMLPGVEASVLSVCGWQPARVHMNPPSQSSIDQARKDHLSIPVFIYLNFERPTWQQVVVLVDNRESSAGKLSVGEYVQDVPANSARKLTFPYWPHCDEATHLRFDGDVVGDILEDPNSPATAMPMLFDTSGNRCYRHEWRTYSSSPGGFGGSGTRLYKAQRLRALSSGVDYFLQPLPNLEYSTNSIVQKSAITEISCNDAK